MAAVVVKVITWQWNFHFHNDVNNNKIVEKWSLDDVLLGAPKVFLRTPLFSRLDNAQLPAKQSQNLNTNVPLLLRSSSAV